jgi:hypothetical protein
MPDIPRVIKAQRASGTTVALHDADVRISVESATDVAKDPADIVLLDKDLAILDGWSSSQSRLGQRLASGVRHSRLE